jgi:carbon starvation protein
MGALFGTVFTILPAMIILYQTKSGMWAQFWTLFGAANQLLAALSLLVISAWLHQNRKRLAFTLIPMVFVLITTMVALVQLVRSNLAQSSGLDISLFNGLVSLALILLALYLVTVAALKMKESVPGSSK